MRAELDELCAAATVGGTYVIVAGQQRTLDNVARRIVDEHRGHAVGWRGANAIRWQGGGLIYLENVALGLERLRGLRLQGAMVLEVPGVHLPPDLEPYLHSRADPDSKFWLCWP
jgi:hypothetical protein